MCAVFVIVFDLVCFVCRGVLCCCVCCLLCLDVCSVLCVVRVDFM